MNTLKLGILKEHWLFYKLVCIKTEKCFIPMKRK